MGTVSQYTPRSNDDRHQRRDRLVLALHLVCTAVGACGMRLVYLLLQITGLNRFVGASYGTQQQVNRRVDEAIVAYRREERARLAHKMPAKAITLTQDATLHALRTHKPLQAQRWRSTDQPDQAASEQSAETCA